MELDIRGIAEKLHKKLVLESEIQKTRAEGVALLYNAIVAEAEAQQEKPSGQESNKPSRLKKKK